MLNIGGMASVTAETADFFALRANSFFDVLGPAQGGDLAQGARTSAWLGCTVTCLEFVLFASHLVLEMLDSKHDVHNQVAGLLLIVQMYAAFEASRETVAQAFATACHSVLCRDLFDVDVSMAGLPGAPLASRQSKR
jgi:hypothetical protein